MRTAPTAALFGLALLVCAMQHAAATPGPRQAQAVREKELYPEELGYAGDTRTYKSEGALVFWDSSWMTDDVYALMMSTRPGEDVLKFVLYVMSVTKGHLFGYDFGGLGLTLRGINSVLTAGEKLYATTIVNDGDGNEDDISHALLCLEFPGLVPDNARAVLIGGLHYNIAIDEERSNRVLAISEPRASSFDSQDLSFVLNIYNIDFDSRNYSTEYSQEIMVSGLRGERFLFGRVKGSVGLFEKSIYMVYEATVLHFEIGRNNIRMVRTMQIQHSVGPSALARAVAIRRRPDNSVILGLIMVGIEQRELMVAQIPDTGFKVFSLHSFDVSRRSDSRFQLYSVSLNAEGDTVSFSGLFEHQVHRFDTDKSVVAFDNREPFQYWAENPSRAHKSDFSIGQPGLFMFTGTVVDTGALETSITVMVLQVDRTGGENDPFVNAGNDGSNSCFPASARVMMASGEYKRMDELKSGDKLRTGAGAEHTSELAFWGHLEHSGIYRFVRISYEQCSNDLCEERHLTMSPGHLVYTYPDFQPKTARSIERAQRIYLLGTGSTSFELAEITQVNFVYDKGLYQPHTLEPGLIVEGVFVSAYTEAMLPRLAHSLLLPVRLMYIWMRWNLLGNFFHHRSDLVRLIHSAASRVLG
ncbi:Desert hedgehog protein B [Porphyridium purpureum]|uniref:Desert hedgehog protein B n=1 Tax=Porphyridium purpureum TaxID=35688 RepID=A0A5J4YPU2_PORPP|nr:Desert hedgehog protein B [Porphyridium purpureum]|eukprot:POR4824..scf222_8